MRISWRLPPPLNKSSCPAPRAPAALPGVPGRRSQVSVASVCPSHRQGARSAQGGPQPGARLPAPDAAYLLTWPRRNPGVPRRKAALRGRRSPKSPQGIDSSGWRRRGGGKEPEEAKGEILSSDIVLVAYCCFNKQLLTQWLRTIHSCYLIAL